MLVAMLALLPNAIWGEEHLNAYIQEFKTAWGASEGKGVLINDIESILLANNMLEKTSDGTQYDVSKKPLFLKISIFKKMIILCRMHLFLRFIEEGHMVLMK